jgi:syntaxin-binding protein 1
LSLLSPVKECWNGWEDLCCLNFTALESRAFVTSKSVANENNLFALYFPKGLEELDIHLSSLAEQLQQVFPTLDNKPVIKYFEPTGKKTGLAARMARKLSALFPASDNVGEEAELLILDRSFDMFAPLIHSLTYEAACYDFLDVKDGVVSYLTLTQCPQNHR